MLCVSVYTNLQSGPMLCLRDTIYLAIFTYILVLNCFENILGLILLAKFPVQNLKFRNVNLEKKRVHSYILHFVIWIQRDFFSSLEIFSPHVCEFLCGFSQGYDDPCQITLRLGFSMMLIGCYWNVGSFSCARGRREVPTRHVISDGRQDGRNKRSTVFWEQFLFLLLYFSLPFSFIPFSFPSSIFIGLRPRILI